MKKITMLVAAIFTATAVLAGCGTTEGGDSDSLVVYTPNSEDLITTLVPMFEQETGIKVEVISAGTGELLGRIDSEKNSPYADVLWGGTYSSAVENIDLFAEYTSPNDADLLEAYQNKTGRVSSYVLDGNALLVNTNLIGDIEINGYEDLLNPELKGKIAHTDASSSSSAFNHLTNMLLAMGGDYESEEGWDFVRQFVENLDGKIASGSGAVHRSVADGEFVVGLTWEDPAVGYIRSGGAPVKIVHPAEGTAYAASALAIVEGAPNMENAQKFVDFMLGQEAQETIGANLNNRPIREGIESADYMVPLDDINLVYEDTDYIIENKADIVARYLQIVQESEN